MKNKTLSITNNKVTIKLVEKKVVRGPRQGFKYMSAPSNIGHDLQDFLGADLVNKILISWCLIH
mgnify:CR=1 FL=1